MVETVYNMFVLIFGGGLAGKLVGNGTPGNTGFLGTLMEAASGVMKMDIIGKGMTVFSGIAASLLVVFFFMDMLSMASKDMMSLEKMMLAFIKLLIAFAIVLYVREIIITLFDLGKAIYGYVGEKLIGKNYTSMLRFWGESAPPDYSVVEQDLKAVYGKSTLTQTVSALGSVIYLIFPALCSYLAIGAAYLLCVTNSIQIITYGLFAPIAVTQYFDERTNSSGIRYLKKFASLCLSFAVIIGILWAVSQIQDALISGLMSSSGITAAAGGTYNIDATNFKDVISFKNAGFIITFVVVQFAAVGGIMKSTQIAGDVLGVR